MKKYDTIGYAQKRAAELMDEAIGTSRTIDWRGEPPAVSLLQAFARFAVQRQW
jgi:hypothetical protein